MVLMYRKSFLKSARSEARTHFQNAFSLDTPPCNTGGFENNINQVGDLKMKAAFYDSLNESILIKIDLDATVTPAIVPMVTLFISRSPTPTDYLVFYNEAGYRYVSSLHGVAPLVGDAHKKALDALDTFLFEAV
jgi:hypothetical protein